MKLKQILKVTDPEQRVHVKVYAYGVFYASTFADGMKTAEDVLSLVRKDILNVNVISVMASNIEDNRVFPVLLISVELCK